MGNGIKEKGRMVRQDNKSNRVWTMNAFSLVLLLAIYYYHYSKVIQIVIYAFLFQTLTYLNFGGKRHSNRISTRL